MQDKADTEKKPDQPKEEEEELRDESDLIAKDQNGRNILHRAALEQQLDLI